MTHEGTGFPKAPLTAGRRQGPGPQRDALILSWPGAPASPCPRPPGTELAQNMFIQRASQRKQPPLLAPEPLAFTEDAEGGEKHRTSGPALWASRLAGHKVTRGDGKTQGPLQSVARPPGLGTRLRGKDGIGTGPVSSVCWEVSHPKCHLVLLQRERDPFHSKGP